MLSEDKNSDSIFMCRKNRKIKKMDAKILVYIKFHGLV